VTLPPGTLRPYLEPFVAALLNKKKAQPAPNQKLICRCFRTCLHDPSQIHRQGSSSVKPVSRGLCSGLASARWTTPRPPSGPPSHFALVFPCLSSVGSTPAAIVGLPSGLLRLDLRQQLVVGMPSGLLHAPMPPCWPACRGTNVPSLSAP
jgi:hypothetical protein